MSERGGLECRRIDVSVPGRLLVGGLEAHFAPGRLVAVLGPNGAGKSSLLHVLAGLGSPSSGQVVLDGRPVPEWPRRDFARRVALLPQASEDPFPGSVLDSALVGRHPHIEFWRWESASDVDVARRCLAELDLAGLDSRDVASLSGGERRRLAIAAVLAQEPRTYLLDEPIQQLDPLHQLGVLRLFRARADAGDAVVMSLHDPGLAARFAHESLLLFGDGRWRHGPSDEVLDAESIGALYGAPVRELCWEDGRTFVPR